MDVHHLVVEASLVGLHSAEVQWDRRHLPEVAVNRDHLNLVLDVVARRRSVVVVALRNSVVGSKGRPHETRVEGPDRIADSAVADQTVHLRVAAEDLARWTIENVVTALRVAAQVREMIATAGMALQDVARVREMMTIVAMGPRSAAPGKAGEDPDVTVTHETVVRVDLHLDSAGFVDHRVARIAVTEIGRMKARDVDVVLRPKPRNCRVVI